ncbi:MAG: acyl-CoA thioesterase [Bacteroidota bacterium]
MFSASTQIRVRYGETDQMGVVYHGNYALFFESARTEALRAIGISYKAIEESGVMMPVHSLSFKYLKSAKYDDLITVVAKFNHMPTVRAVIEYEVYNEANELLCTGESTLVFMDVKTNRVTRCPQILEQALIPYFKA